MSEKLFEKAQALVTNGKKLKQSGNIEECIKQMTRAITLYRRLQKEDTNLISLHLCEAYCFRALSIQEIQPSKKQIITDIFRDLKAALDLWLRVYKDDYIQGELEFQNNTMVLLLNVIDLSQLKGFIELSKQAYQVALKIFKMEKIPVEKWLPFLWQTRRLNDAPCVSYVDETFFKVPDLAKLNAWEDALKEHPHALQGFLQNIYFTCINSHDDKLNSEAFSTFEKVQNIAKELETTFDLTSKELTTKDIHSIFVAGYLHLDTSRRLVANGELHEAFLHASKANELFARVFQENFQNSDDPSKIKVQPKVVDKVFLFTSNSLVFPEHYLSPWKVLQGYLEGILQFGMVKEVIGDSAGAQDLFYKGKNLSQSLKLHMFAVTFSLLLGKVFLKESISAEKRMLEALYIKAKSNLRYAENTLKRQMCCCSKCRVMCDVILDQYNGSLLQMRISAYDEKNVEEATKRYDNALESLNGDTLNNNLSCPKDVIAKQICACSGNNTNISTKSEPKRTKTSSVSSTRSTACSLPIGRCWYCLPCEAMESGSVEVIINVKWESVRRQVLLELQSLLVEFCEDSDKERKILLNGISALVGSNSLSTFTCLPKDCIKLMVAVEVQGDIFAIERAKLIYAIGLHSLRNYGAEFTSTLFCNSEVNFDDIASWLTVAFVLSREVPGVLQKVSRLLAFMYSLSSSREEVSLSHSKKNLSENLWAAYYHQASVGAHVAYGFHLGVAGRVKGECNNGSLSSVEDSSNSLGRVPKATKDLESHVKKFLVGHSTATIINISILGPDHTNFLQQLMSYTAHTKDQVSSPQTNAKAWMLVSRICFEAEPVVMLLPLDSIAKDDIDHLTEYRLKDKRLWHCPWNGFTVIDEIVPSFREMIEENYYADFKIRGDIDNRFDELLRNIEDSWFGPWKCVLGELLNSKQFDLVLKKVADHVRNECNLEINEDILKLFLGASEYYCGVDNTLDSQLCSEEYCYLAGVGYVDNAERGILPFPNATKMTAYHAALEYLKKEFREFAVTNAKFKNNCEMKRRPTILVLDCEVQMLPWESFPLIRLEEIYRMPSVSSIFANLETRSFSLVDPLDTYYLVNSDDHWSRTAEEYFKSKNLEGIKGGDVSNSNELISAIEKHNLYLYFDHNCGSQYIPHDELMKLEKCPAALLMGCASGASEMNGNYAPTCTPIPYLLAGSPFIISNLWVITSYSGYIFIKQLHKAMLNARSFKCALCKGRRRKMNCEHRHEIGSLIKLARQNIPLLFWTSTVIYGLPTTIWTKDLDNVKSKKKRNFVLRGKGKKKRKFHS